MFMEKIVLAKSYSAQLHRSTSGARSAARISPSGSTTGRTCSGCAIRAPSGCGATVSFTLASHGGRRHTSRDVAGRCAVDGGVSQSKLRDMKLFRATWMVLGLAVACERAKSPPPVETATATPISPADSAKAATALSWDVSAGPVLLVASTTPAEALVIPSDSASATSQLASIPRPASVTLFGRNGSVQSAELPKLTESGGCATGTLHAAPPPRVWNVGFVGGVIAPIAMDSTQSLSPADSLRLVVAVTRLASALPNDPAGRFVGLPFVVRDLWRFIIAGGPTVVIA